MEKYTEEIPDEDDTISVKGGFALVLGDLDIFKLIYEYRFLRREHLCALTGRPPKRLHRRLLKLLEEGYLTVIRLPQQKHIYGLGKRALPVLVEQGSADPDILSQRLRTHEIKELFLKHEMMIVELHLILSLAMRDSDLKLVSWHEGRDLYDWVTVRERNVVKRLPIRPDAFFTIEDLRRPVGANRAHFFLEADRSTATQTRFQEKILAYWHYLDQGLHAKKFGIKTFRTLTVTITPERSENLCALAASILPAPARKPHFFTSFKNFSLENPSPILTSIYLSARSAGTDQRYPLVPPPTASQNETAMV